MTKLKYNLHRVFGCVLSVLLLLLAANYYLDLGLFGRAAKMLMILVMGVVVVWGTFFFPTRQEREEYEQARSRPKDR